MSAPLDQGHCRHPKVRRPSRPVPDWKVRCADCGEAVTHDGRGGFVTLREVNVRAAALRTAEDKILARAREIGHDEALRRLETGLDV